MFLIVRFLIDILAIFAPIFDWMKKSLNIKEKYLRFKEWREHPRQVAPLSQEEHECLNCHDHYTGNYCPRCGQTATTKRFSWKIAARNFAVEYGMGERGMFRTMRDLILRPGYLILDYLRGMRASYFAPFKMFFLLFALSTFVTHGLNIKGQPLYGDSEAAVQKLDEEIDEEKGTTAELDTLEINKESLNVSDHTKAFFLKFFDRIERLEERFPSINMLFLLMIVSGFLYLFFRHCPKIPDLRYPEFFIALLYTDNMYTIYSIVFDFFCLTKISSLAIFLTLIPLKQMSGYSWWRTTLKAVTAFVIMFVLLVALVVLAMFLLKWFGLK